MQIPKLLDRISHYQLEGFIDRHAVFSGYIVVFMARKVEVSTNKIFLAKYVDALIGLVISYVDVTNPISPKYVHGEWRTRTNRE
jgi:hypothetical protein